MTGCTSTDQLYELLMAEAVAHYEQREQELGEPVMREVERQVMMKIIDQKWREHLEEMDYLREGIDLRAMGQKDPLTEWQREGYAMFEAMMGGVAQDFVRYAMQVQVNVVQPGSGRRGSRSPPSTRTTSRRSGPPMRCRRCAPDRRGRGPDVLARRPEPRCRTSLLRARRVRDRRRPVRGGAGLGRRRAGHGAADEQDAPESTRRW